MRTDIAIIGSGPAGISAAITAKARNKSILLFGGGGISEKIGKAHLIRNYPGLPEISGAELEKAYSRHLAAMGLSITQERPRRCLPDKQRARLHFHAEPLRGSFRQLP